MSSTILKNTFGSEPRWVNFKMVTKGGKTTKIPYSPITGRMASSTDQKTWATYDVARGVSENIGIIFTPMMDLLGIDIDHCINKETGEVEHEQKETIEKLIKEANTYVEISPSGTGIHLFLMIVGGTSLKLTSNKKSPYECYTAGRYFTVTENPYKEYDIEVRRVTADEALKVLEIIGYPWEQTEATPLLDKPTVTNTGGPLSDNEVLDKMMASKNGSKIRDLYNGGGTGDISKDDMALCSHLAFWCAKDETQIERLWMASPLGSREKTQKRQDYRTRTIRNAVKACKEVYTLSPVKTMEKKIKVDSPELNLLFKLTMKGDKIFLQNTENMVRILRYDARYKDRIKYDTFTNTMFFRPFGTEEWRQFEDHDAITVQTKISVDFPVFSMVAKTMIYDAIFSVAKINTFDSAKDFLQSKTWDNVARLDKWLTEVYGADDDIYHQKVGSNWMKGLVKRIMVPGCKFDYVLVLEGPQGTKKSTSLSILGEMADGSNWHVETNMSTDNKDFFMQFSGKAIIEFSEGETLSRTEVKRMKAIITTQADKYRPPYERVSQDFKRRCVFAMTTNESEYLKDETGNRRWLPVELKLDQANIEWLETNRDQLFAEAYHRVMVLKETIHEFPIEETLMKQEARRVQDVNTDLIVDWYIALPNITKNDGISIREVYVKALGNSSASFTKPLDKLDEMRIGGVLRTTLKLIKKQTMVEGQRVVRWYPSAPTTESFMKQIIEKDPLEAYFDEDIKKF